VINVHEEDMDDEVKLSTDVENVHSLPVDGTSISVVMFVFNKVVGYAIICKSNYLHKCNSIPINIKVLLILETMVLY
jgi:hypothetical protein